MAEKRTSEKPSKRYAKKTATLNLSCWPPNMREAGGQNKKTGGAEIRYQAHYA